MNFRLNRRMRDITALFANQDYIDARVLFVIHFDEVPCITHISDLNTTKALIYLKDAYAHEMMGRYHNGYFDYDESKVQFFNIILLLSDKRMVDIGHNYIRVLHTIHQADKTSDMMKSLAEFKLPGSEIRPSIGFARPSDN